MVGALEGFVSFVGKEVLNVCRKRGAFKSS